MTAPGAAERRPLAPKTVLGDRFEIVELLGRGGYGEVYEAHQLLFGSRFRSVALKLCNEGVVTSENAREVLNDALLVFGLLDENPTLDVAARLVQVYDMGVLLTPAPRAFVSMRLIPGRRTLMSEVYRFRHSAGMPVVLSLRCMRDLLLPLAWMHGLETPAVHGDLKPENVMLTEDSRLVLVDFGLAARMPLGVRGGTLAYDAPEKLHGLQGGPEADVYSLGLIWYELLTGQHPFKDVGLDAMGQGDLNAYKNAQIQAREWPICPRSALRSGQVQQRIAPAGEINLDLSEQHPQIEMLLNRCLANKQSERLPNARVLLDSINAYIERGGTLANSDIALFASPPAAASAPAPAQAQAELSQRTNEMRLADALALVNQGRPDQALAVAERILADEPHSIPALLAQARALVAFPSRLAEADEVCGRALAFAPRDPAVYDTLAALREAQGKRAQAAGFRSTAADLRRRRVPGSGH